jgi:GDP-4-dehydro-6-deoxy-D-mannose reductase
MQILSGIEANNTSPTTPDSGLRVMVTGALGFVGMHVLDALGSSFGTRAEIAATALTGSQHPVLGTVRPLDVTDATAVAACIAAWQPTHVVHLAGIAAVTSAINSPELAWKVHLDGTINLARAILRSCPSCWLLNAGSGLVYGTSARSGLPLDEDALLGPLDEYAASKAAADLALGALAERGLNCVRLRPFNHIGPGQSEAFVVPSFAMQIAKIETGLADPVLRVGNLEAQRDFLDVRDVAKAYVEVIRATARLPSGIVLNIASGIPRRIADVLQLLLAHCPLAIAIEQDTGRLRSSDLPMIMGDSSRARDIIGWNPTYKFEDTLKAILDDCRGRVSRLDFEKKSI